MMGESVARYQGQTMEVAARTLDRKNYMICRV